MNKKAYISLFIMLLLAQLSYAQVESKKFQKLIDSMYTDEVERICIEDAAEKIDSFQILDIRSDTEYAISHIENAQFIDYDTFSEENISNLSIEQDVLVYCSIGVRSEEVGKRLKDLGYTVYNLEGGIFEWKNQDMPIYNSDTTRTDSVHVYSRLWGYWMRNGIKVF